MKESNHGLGEERKRKLIVSGDRVARDQEVKADWLLLLKVVGRVLTRIGDWWAGCDQISKIDVWCQDRS